MLDRIEQGVEEQHRLVADASHELRTPLAAMRSEIDVSLRADDLPPPRARVLESAREEVDRMTRTVDDLLVAGQRSTRAGSSCWSSRSICTTSSRARVAVAGPAGAPRDVRVSLDGPARDGGRGRDRLGHAVRNLVENAIEFSPAGRRGRGDDVGRGGEVGVTVRDEGPGVAAELRERIFDRFFRADPSRDARDRGRRPGAGHLAGDRAWRTPGASGSTTPARGAAPSRSRSPGAESGRQPSHIARRTVGGARFRLAG